MLSIFSHTFWPSVCLLCENVYSGLFPFFFFKLDYIYVCVCVCVLEKEKVKVLVIQFCPPLCDPMDCSLSGSSVHGILQTRILEWVAIPFYRGSSWPRDWTQLSCVAGRLFTVWTTREGNGNPLQYSCLENPMDSGAWWPTVHRVAKESDRSQQITNNHIYLSLLSSVSSLYLLFLSVRHPSCFLIFLSTLD